MSDGLLLLLGVALLARMNSNNSAPAQALPGISTLPGAQQKIYVDPGTGQMYYAPADINNLYL